MPQTRINRRRFLLIAGGVLGASALACGGLGALADQQPTAKIDFITSSYGEANTMNGRILVAYASQHGATAGVADAIGKQLAEGGLAADVRRVQEVSDLSPYRAAVVGSAIHSGQWLPEAMAFVEAHQAELNRMPTAIFLVCGMLGSPTTPYRSQVQSWHEPVRALVRPVGEGCFAGAILYKNYRFFEGLGMRIFVASIKAQEGDYRDWPAIRAWADSIRPLLQA
ncbi:MAG TPA: flavodoxin domain-containing protein [Anaerolineae bacterium]|nr:flavodoxin domain-containing protein [Anaerolineae bacterium]HPL30148.1 flavodoxin domain-containing protein [Anaerolineae bacterium]